MRSKETVGDEPMNDDKHGDGDATQLKVSLLLFWVGCRVESGLPAAIKPAVKILISRAIRLTAKPRLIQLKRLGI